MNKIEFTFGQAVKFGFGFGLGLFLLSLIPWIILFLIITARIGSF